MDPIDILDLLNSDELKLLRDLVLREPQAVANAIADRLFDLDFAEDEEADAMDRLAEDEAIEEQFRLWEHEQAIQAGMGWDL
jgi:hypothetical protein